MRRLLSLSLFVLAACGTAEVAPEDTAPPVRLERSDVEVRFPGADHELEGVLTLPARDEGVPVTAVLLVHGSGPNGRDSALSGQLNMGFGTEIAVFADLADQLAEAGYAVLRYDKRTCFSLSGCDNDYPSPEPDVGVLDFLADADAALDWLGQQPEIGSLVVAGHSQGASFVPRLLDEREDLAAGVLLAGPHRPIDAMIRFQLESSQELLAELGYGTGTQDAALGELEALADGLDAVRAGSFQGATLGGAPVDFWSEWMALDDASPGLAVGVEQPLLVLAGDYDWNVPPSEVGLWAADLEPLDRGHHTVLLPCVTHALNCVAEPDWHQIGVDDIGTGVDPEVGAAIADFLDGT